MTADDTSRDALVERVAQAQLWAETNGLCDLDKTCDLCDCFLTSESAKTDGAQRRQTAAAVVDAVVMPLVEAAEAKWVDWLVDTAYPFDYTATPPPPVNMQALADRWNEVDDWQVTPEEALNCILYESGIWHDEETVTELEGQVRGPSERSGSCDHR